MPKETQMTNSQEALANFRQVLECPESFRGFRTSETLPNIATLPCAQKRRRRFAPLRRDKSAPQEWLRLELAVFDGGRAVLARAAAPPGFHAG
jgi:hypothetical protein